MSDQNKPFRVTDRRQFAGEGDRRVNHTVDPPQTESLQDGHPVDGSEEAAVDFAGFILSLAAQAGAHLEGHPGGASDGNPDLKGAKTIIGILEMLQQKTEGHRTPEENQLLEHLLYQLRLGYVARAGAVKT